MATSRVVCSTDHFAVHITVNDVEIPMICDDEGNHYVESNLTTPVSYKVKTEEWVKDEKESQSWPVTPYQIVIRRFSEPDELTCYFDIRVDGVKVKSCTLDSNTSRKISGFKDQGQVKEFLFSLPRFTKSQTDRLDEERYGRVGVIEVECYEADYVADSFHDRKRLDYQQASKNDARGVTGGNYTMSTTKVGRVLYTKEANRRVHVWRKKRLLSSTTVRYRMGHTLREMGLTVPEFPYIPPVSQYSILTANQRPNTLRLVNRRMTSQEAEVDETVTVKRERPPMVIDLTGDDDSRGSESGDSDVEFLGTKRVKIETVDLTEGMNVEILEESVLVTGVSDQRNQGEGDEVLDSSNREDILEEGEGTGGQPCIFDEQGSSDQPGTSGEPVILDVQGNLDDHNVESVPSDDGEADDSDVVVVHQHKESSRQEEVVLGDSYGEDLLDDDGSTETGVKFTETGNMIPSSSGAVAMAPVASDDVFDLLDLDFDDQGETSQTHRTLSEELIDEDDSENGDDELTSVIDDVTGAKPDDVIHNRQSAASGVVAVDDDVAGGDVIADEENDVAKATADTTTETGDVQTVPELDTRVTDTSDHGNTDTTDSEKRNIADVDISNVTRSPPPASDDVINTPPSREHADVISTSDSTDIAVTSSDTTNVVMDTVTKEPVAMETECGENVIGQAVVQLTSESGATDTTDTVSAVDNPTVDTGNTRGMVSAMDTGGTPVDTDGSTVVDKNLDADANAAVEQVAIETDSADQSGPSETGENCDVTNSKNIDAEKLPENESPPSPNGAVVTTSDDVLIATVDKDSVANGNGEAVVVNEAEDESVLDGHDSDTEHVATTDVCDDDLLK